MRPRVLLAGLFHETHTFLAGETVWQDFQIRRGPELLAAVGDGSPLAGVVEVGRDRGWEFVPALDARAMPSAAVADEVFERFWQELEAVARPALAEGLHGIFLVIHGAMACSSIPDVEGELLARVRSLPGAGPLPLVGVYDLHANFSARMAEHASALVAYRENPHTDAHAAAVHAAELLDRFLRTGERPQMVWSRPPLVWPPTGTGTADDPMRSLERQARALEAEHPELLVVNVTGGYSYADTPDTGVSFSAATLGEPAFAQAKLQQLTDFAWAHRAQGNRLDMPLADALEQIARDPLGPQLLVEPADNIGGGAPGDGTSLLRALLAHDLRPAAVVINDPHAVQRLLPLGIGERATVTLGGRGSPLGEGPVTLEVELFSRSDGRFTLEDPHSHLASMYGLHIDMGPCATVRHGELWILLTSRKTPPFDLGQLRSQGIDPVTMRVIGVKAAVAHRRAYDSIAHASFTVATPGPCASDLSKFPYRLLKRPVYPLDKELG